jgi:hypothetical protein
MLGAETPYKESRESRERSESPLRLASRNREKATATWGEGHQRAGARGCRGFRIRRLQRITGRRRIVKGRKDGTDGGKGDMLCVAAGRGARLEHYSGSGGGSGVR